jgi:N-methylhydantoinase A/oxoprolinase/acetone carboxylase beta subunit
VLEISERITADGAVLAPLDAEAAREQGEYERTVATILNSHVAPVSSQVPETLLRKIAPEFDAQEITTT